MSDVPDRLVPRDGLTNSYIKFVGLDAAGDAGAAVVRFDMHNENGTHIGTFRVVAGPTKNGSIDQMVSRAHRQMCDVLRQWLYMTDKMAQAYEKREAHRSQEGRGE